MSKVTQILINIEQGDPQAAEQLLPLVYDELRKLAANRLAVEKPGYTLQATALVHEAFLRLVGDQQYDGRGHFFAAAAEAMRRVLVDRARNGGRRKRGGGYTQVALIDIPNRTEIDPDLVLSLDDSLERLHTEDPAAADLAKMHLFAGLSIEECAIALGVSRATAFRNWSYARAWLQDALAEKP